MYKFNQLELFCYKDISEFQNKILDDILNDNLINVYIIGDVKYFHHKDKLKILDKVYDIIDTKKLHKKWLSFLKDIGDPQYIIVYWYKLHNNFELLKEHKRNYYLKNKNKNGY